jgi:tRNA-specific 2-thiouridylase
MKNWEEQEELGYCTGERDYADATRVCQTLSIPLHRADFVKDYWNEVFTPFLDGLRRGETPNPDILCNREIKFNNLYRWSMERIGADFFATGHYARTRRDDNGRWRLMQAVDNAKDQTYFLSSINESVLARTLFPVGDLHKSQVRRIAQEANLVTATKPDSMGICFIGKRPFKEFLGKRKERKRERDRERERKKERKKLNFVSSFLVRSIHSLSNGPISYGEPP